MTESAAAPPGASRRALFFCLAAWAAASLGAAAFVLAFGRDVPFADDWAFVEGAAGREPFWPWVWTPHNEHRLPIARLATAGLARLTGFDSRAGMAASVAMLSALALGLILAMRRWRGESRYADAIFPLLLLDLGQYFNLLMNTQVFVAAAAMARDGLAFAFFAEAWKRRGGIAAMGLGLWLLPLCGGYGLILAAFALPVFLAAAAARMREGDRRGRTSGAALLFFAAGGAALMALYFAGYHPAAPDDSTSDPARILAVFAQYMSQAFGAVPLRSWPVMGAGWIAAGVAAAAWLGWKAARGRQGRLRALALLMVFCAVMAEGLAVALRRGGAHPTAGFHSRFLTTATLFGLALYFAGETIPSPRWRRLAGTLLLAAALLHVPYGIYFGVREGRKRAETLDAFLGDARAGMDARQLGERYADVLHVPHSAYLARRIEVLQSEGWGPFRDAKTP